MGFFLRKGFNIGPLRLNLSKSGIGASFGVKGARVGVNAKGKGYVAGGRGGLYYRKQFPLSIAPEAAPIAATGNILDRVLDVTEHLDHAVAESATEPWNSRVYDHDLTLFKEKIARIKSGSLYVKGVTPGQVVLGTGQCEIRLLFEPLGETTTRLTIIALDEHGHDVSAQPELKAQVLSMLDTADEAIQRVNRRTSDKKVFFIILAAIAALCWFFALVGRVSDKPQATVTKPTATVTPTPAPQKKHKHK